MVIRLLQTMVWGILGPNAGQKHKYIDTWGTG